MVFVRLQPAAPHATRRARPRGACRFLALFPFFGQPAPLNHADSLLSLLAKHKPRWQVAKPRPGEVDVAGAHSRHASDTPDASVRRHVRVAPHGGAALKALQVLLYEQGEQARARGCRRCRGDC